jgi:hypothetical protein
MKGKMIAAVVAVCCVVLLNFSGITGFFSSSIFGQNQPAPPNMNETGKADGGSFLVEDFKETGKKEAPPVPQENNTENENQTAGGQQISDEGYFSGGGGGGSSAGHQRCSMNSECGTDSMGQLYCSGSKVYQDQIGNVCNNPGTPSSYCTTTRTPILKEECQICYAGHCVGQAVAILLNPSQTTASTGSQFGVAVNVNAPYPVFALQFEMYFDPQVLEVVEVKEDNFLKNDNVSTYQVTSFDNDAGKIVFASTRYGTENGITGGGTLSKITFRGKAAGSTNLEFQNVIVSDPNIEEIPNTSIDGVVNISS